MRIKSDTIEARNGVMRELLVRKGDTEPWDKQPCATATVADIDLIVLRDTLQRIGIPDPAKGIDEYLSADRTLHALLPPLCFKEPLTGILRPRNFAILLFGRVPQQHIPGAYCSFSVYLGTDRSEVHAERHELTETLIEQVKRLSLLLEAQSYIAFDKSNGNTSPNARKYPANALREAMVNALAHRDYLLHDPVRITAFADRSKSCRRDRFHRESPRMNSARALRRPSGAIRPWRGSWAGSNSRKRKARGFRLSCGVCNRKAVRRLDLGLARLPWSALCLPIRGM